MIRASVVGASGYSGAELVRLLCGHREVELVELTAGQQQGRRMHESFPSFRGFVEREMVAPDWAALAAESDVVFLALPHGLSMHAVPTLLEGDTRVVDLGADFRLRDVATYEKWYGLEHKAPGLLGSAVYGLPELNREALGAARLAACPGCYPTAAALALLPALSFCRAGAPVIVDAKSGVSGAGRGLSNATHYGEVNESVAPYKVGAHRHMPEMEQTLRVAGAGERVFFTPHLIPMTRGILATCYVSTADPVDQAEIEEVYRSRYEAEPFVRFLGDQPPQTKATQGANFCDVAVRAEPELGLIVAMSAIDNLVKGAAGQAIQCMNLMFGLDEEEGLWLPPLFP
jgi:N-acetyl-gamma-glutamyl-phosphate reductase